MTLTFSSLQTAGAAVQSAYQDPTTNKMGLLAGTTVFELWDTIGESQIGGSLAVNGNTIGWIYADRWGVANFSTTTCSIVDTFASTVTTFPGKDFCFHPSKPNQFSPLGCLAFTPGNFLQFDPITPAVNVLSNLSWMGTTGRQASAILDLNGGGTVVGTEDGRILEIGTDFVPIRSIQLPIPKRTWEAAGYSPYVWSLSFGVMAGLGVIAASTKSGFIYLLDLDTFEVMQVLQGQPSSSTSGPVLAGKRDTLIYTQGQSTSGLNAVQEVILRTPLHAETPIWTDTGDAVQSSGINFSANKYWAAGNNIKFFNYTSPFPTGNTSVTYAGLPLGVTGDLMLINDSGGAGNSVLTNYQPFLNKFGSAFYNIETGLTDLMGILHETGTSQYEIRRATT